MQITEGQLRQLITEAQLRKAIRQAIQENLQQTQTPEFSQQVIVNHNI